MHPQFKSLPFLQPEEKRQVEAAIECEMTTVLDLAARDSNRSEGSEPLVKQFRREHKLMELLEDVVNPTLDQDTTSVGEKAKAELARYIGEVITDKNPLLWRKESSVCYPTLIHLVCKYLCIPATSVPSERAFSIAGHIVNEKRACLHPETVNMMVFLAENLK